MAIEKDDLEWILSQYELLTNEKMKKRSETKEIDFDDRPPYQRDHARILYSSSFRRLQGKMQLLGIENDQFFRNRLTHSLEVSQIAEGIVSLLNLEIKNFDVTKSIYNCDEDLYVIRAASLAHDLGNPPFGHAGEHVLNRLAKNYDGFEGNAQTIRILRYLEKKSPEFQGLNLTNRTLLSVLKYNVSHASAKEDKGIKSKYIYNGDFDAIQIIRKELGIKGRTLDAQIMDLADEIAYSAHDLEDCLSLKVFDIDEFEYEFSKWAEEKIERKESYVKLNEIIENAKRIAKKCNYYKNSEEYKDILKKEITSKIVDNLIKDIGVVKVIDKAKLGTDEDYELGFKRYKELATGLKKLTFKALKRKKHVKLYEAQGKIVLEELFKFYLKNYELMATEYVSLIDKEIKGEKSKEEKDEIKIKYILDYISGMMDSYALKKYNEFFGEVNLKKLLIDN